jgi:hypothetical protein
MFKKSWLFLVLLMALLLVACGDSEKKEPADTKETTETKKGSTDDDSSKNNASESSSTKDVLEVVIPVEYIVEESEEEIKEKATSIGVKDVTVNADGSVTYKIPEGEKAKVVENMQKVLEDLVDEAIFSGSLTSITAISLSNHDLFTFTTTNEQEYTDSWDPISVMVLYMHAAQIQFVQGVAEEDIKVRGIFADSDLNDYLEEEFPADYK